MISLLTGILLIESIISYSAKNYNLTNGESKIIPIIKKDSDLTFYVKASKNQMAITSISMISSISPTSLIITCEYENTSSKCMNALREITSFKKDGKTLSTSSKYVVSSKEANYVGINLYFNEDVSNFNITTYVGGQTYDLTNGISKTLKDLLPLFPYVFYIPAKKNQMINVTMIINDTENPFYQAQFKEYSARDDEKELDSRRQSIKKVSPKNNKLRLSFYYIIYSKETNYLAFIIEPNTKITNIQIKVEVNYCYNLNSNYNLYDNFTENLSNLKSGTNYYLHFSLLYLQTAKVKLSFNKMSSKPFNNIYISEYEDKGNSYPIKYSNEIVSFNKLSNSLVTNITINNYDYNYNTKYIILNFSSLYDIDNLQVLLDIGGSAQYLKVSSNIIYTTAYVKSGFSYYLFMEIKQNNTANLTLDFHASNPFDYVEIYEYKSKNCSIFQKDKSTKIKTENIIDKLQILYTPSIISTNYIALNITSSVDIGVIYPTYIINKKDLL